MIEFLILVQTLILLAGVVFFIYKNMDKKEAPVVVIESLPKGISKGFGYVKGKSVILNEKQIPYLYKTYEEALKNMHKVEGADKIIYQDWDMATQTVFVGEVRHGTD